MPDLLRLAEADPDTAKKVVGAMCSPAGTRSPWQLAGKPLCCCFPCPCCERVSVWVGGWGVRQAGRQEGRE